MEAYLSEILTAIISISVSYGVMKTELHYMKEKLEQYDKDHDLLVEIKTKIDLLLTEEPNKRSKK